MVDSYEDFELMKITITDTTSREDLLAIIRDLDDERQKLHDGWETASREAEEFSTRVCEMESRIEQAADILAAQGAIHNTPYAKARWIAGH
jgi:hypothetical protein